MERDYVEKYVVIYTHDARTLDQFLRIFYLINCISNLIFYYVKRLVPLHRHRAPQQIIGKKTEIS